MPTAPPTPVPSSAAMPLSGKPMVAVAATSAALAPHAIEAALHRTDMHPTPRDHAPPGPVPMAAPTEANVATKLNHNGAGQAVEPLGKSRLSEKPGLDVFKPHPRSPEACG